MIHNAEALFESAIPDYPLIGRGKVRDIYSIDDDHLLIVTTDRLSAFDVVLPDPVPGKGEVLTQISLFWFRMMSDVIDNQLTELTVDDVMHDADAREQLYGRSLERMARVLEEIPARGIPPERVADAVEHALTASRPRTRYPVGSDARMGVRLRRLLPDRTFYWLMGRLSGRGA